MATFRRRINAAIAGTAMLGASVGGAVVFSAITAGTASASLPANVTYNDNGCSNSIQTGDVGGIAIGLGSDQTPAALANTVDPTTGLVVVGGGNTTQANAQTLSPPTNVLQGTGGSITNFGTHGFVPIAFLQAGVNLGAVSIGQTVPATINVTVNADNATFNAVQASGVTVVSPTQVVVTGPGSGTVQGNPTPTGTAPNGTVTAPLDAAIQLPNVAYSVPNTPNVNAVFYQDSHAITGTYPGGGAGNNTDDSAFLDANLGFGHAHIACMPGEVTGAAAPHTFTPTSQSNVLVFGVVRISPALPPTLVPQTIASVNSGGSAIVHVLSGATDNVPITVSSVAVVTPPAHGSVTINPANGDATYTNDGTGTTDSFTVTAASSGGTSTPPTVETIGSILANPPSCDVTQQAGCHLKQIILVPVAAGDLVMSQSSGLPIDPLVHTLSGLSCTGPAVTLNGQPQFACGAMAPVSVVNARGTDNGWTLSGQVSDFLDPAAAPTTTCDTVATANNHCIPGGNLSWQPVAAVAHGVVPGDTAAVTAGSPVLALGVQTPSLANAPAALAVFGVATQANPVAEVPALGGLHNGAQTLCQTASGQAGGSFDCGAGLVVAVPASAASPASPGYQATLTLTLA